MGVTAVVSSAGSTSSAGVSVSAISLLSPIGPGIGGVFVAGMLLYLLVYLDLVGVAPIESVDVRSTLLAIIVPLLIVFCGIVAFRTLALI